MQGSPWVVGELHDVATCQTRSGEVFVAQTTGNHIPSFPYLIISTRIPFVTPSYILAHTFSNTITYTFSQSPTHRSASYTSI